ncbi:alpha-L-fucosidase C-terminal domain-containing protein [Sphingobacterium thalpophilum]|nr:alpha-L-fucosidase C-terminal domain-containing protein [Sphingobacterium thalpophilum]
MYSSRDIRFVQKNNSIYAHIMAWPQDGAISIRSLGRKNKAIEPIVVQSVALLGYDKKLTFQQSDEYLSVKLPAIKPNQISLVLKIN